jgi:hypothetical protein
MRSFVFAAAICFCACASTPAAPAPQPAPCGGDAATTEPYTATATWQANDAGTAIVLKITLHLVDPNFTGHITVPTNTLVTAVTPIAGGDVVLTVRPLVGTHTVGVGFDVSCLNKSATVVVTWTADPVDGRSDPAVVTF